MRDMSKTDNVLTSYYKHSAHSRVTGAELVLNMHDCIGLGKWQELVHLQISGAWIWSCSYLLLDWSSMPDASSLLT
jgi:hypothetical protein